MLSFQQDFPGTTLVKLEQNYRSTQVILDAANGVIAENARRLGKTLFTATAGGEPVTLLTAADERDGAEWVAGELGPPRGEAGRPAGTPVSAPTCGTRSAGWRASWTSCGRAGRRRTPPPCSSRWWRRSGTRATWRKRAPRASSGSKTCRS